MMIKLWTESTIFEKIRVVLFITLVFMLILAYLFPSAFIKSASSDLHEQCEQLEAKFTGKFVIINGEAIAVCELD